MAELKRSRLEWAKDVARAYRWALQKADPLECERLDKRARDNGQDWVAPREVPADAAEEAIHTALTPPRLAEVTGVPTNTIYTWIARRLLTPASDEKPAKYWVRDVLAVDARRRARRSC